MWRNFPRFGQRDRTLLAEGERRGPGTKECVLEAAKAGMGAPTEHSERNTPPHPQPWFIPVIYFSPTELWDHKCVWFKLLCLWDLLKEQ